MKDLFKKVYEQHYKKLMILPLLLILLAFVEIGWQYAQTGDFVNKGISLKGGSTIILDYDPSSNIPELESSLKGKFPGADITVKTLSSAGKITSIVVEADATEQQEITALLQAIEEEVSLPAETYSVETVGSALGSSFFRQTITALLVAFLLMGIIVIIYFRNLIPSLAVILAAFSDIVVTLAIFNLTGMKLSTAGIAAFLMLIAYSVDTDILLTTRVLKRKEGTVLERIYGAITTGFTMTATTLAAVLVALIFIQSEIVKQIMLIIFIGLIVDMIMTWIQNAGILRMYMEKKK